MTASRTEGKAGTLARERREPEKHTKNKSVVEAACFLDTLEPFFACLDLSEIKIHSSSAVEVSSDVRSPSLDASILNFPSCLPMDPPLLTAGNSTSWRAR